MNSYCIYQKKKKRKHRVKPTKNPKSGNAMNYEIINALQIQSKLIKLYEMTMHWMENKQGNS